MIRQYLLNTNKNVTISILHFFAIKQGLRLNVGDRRLAVADLMPALRPHPRDREEKSRTDEPR